MVTIRQAFLTIHGGPEDGMALLLSARPVVLGRRADSDIVVDDPAVSRRHALIMDTPHGLVLRDLGSNNGTYVNGVDIGAGLHLLSNEDGIRLADSRVALTFRQSVESRVVLEPEPLASPA